MNAITQNYKFDEQLYRSNPGDKIADDSIYSKGLAIVLRCRILELVGQTVQMHGVNRGGYVELLADEPFMAIDHRTGEIYSSRAFSLAPSNILPLQMPQSGS